MKHLCIQVQPPRVPQLQIAEIRTACEALPEKSPIVLSHDFARADPAGEWFNFIFETDQLEELWQLIQSKLYEVPGLGADLAKASITTCEGEDGWNDYLLLHHFDPAERRDTL